MRADFLHAWTGGAPPHYRALNNPHLSYLHSSFRPPCDELEVAVPRNADGAFAVCLPDRRSYPAVKIAISIKAEMPTSPPSCPRPPSPSGDTLKLATLPSRFATDVLAVGEDRRDK